MHWLDHLFHYGALKVYVMIWNATESYFIYEAWCYLILNRENTFCMAISAVGLNYVP